MAVFRARDNEEREIFRPMNCINPTIIQEAQAAQEEQTRNRVEQEVQSRLTEHTALVEAALRAELQPRIAELELAIPQTESLLDAVAHTRREVMVQARLDIAELVETLTRRIVGAAVAVDKRALMTVVDHAIDTVSHDQILFLRVPEDAADAIRACVHPDVAARVVGEPSLANACEVITAEARVESSLSDVLDQLTQLVHDWAANPS
ncbi:MAG: flagellar biosynthesis/type III secretory pathway protein FliH [Myxococcota bacterium]|jgi:flagellar biosynthesis/type III secretory pathway protein FliH